MKVLEVTPRTDDHPDVVDSELVEFSSGDLLPDERGRRAGESYVYTHESGQRYRRRRMRRDDPALRTSAVYRTLHAALDAEPLITPSKLRNKVDVDADGDEAEYQHARDATEQFFDDFFEHVVRFCNAPGLEPKSATKATWAEHKKEGRWPDETLRQAAMHMSQNSDATDMLSVAVSEGALLRNAGREVCVLMYDTSSGKHAPLIFEFLVPKASLIKPGDTALGGLSSARSRGETEALFYGTGLQQYIVDMRDNPYTTQDRERIQNTDELRELEAQVTPTVTITGLIAAREMTASWPAVTAELKRLAELADSSKQLELAKALTDAAALQRPIAVPLLKLDEAMNKLDPTSGLQLAWNTLVLPFRRKE